MHRFHLPLLLFALLGSPAEADIRKILAEDEPITVFFELPATVTERFDLHSIPLEERIPRGVLLDVELTPVHDQIEVTPLQVTPGFPGVEERFFRLTRLHNGVPLASRTIACSTGGASAITMESCIQSTSTGHLLAVSYDDTKAICGCIAPNTSSNPKPFPGELRVDWATGPGAGDLGTVLTERLDGAGLGPRFVLGRKVTTIPAELTGYSCALAFLRFVQEQRRSDSILLGIIQGTDYVGNPIVNGSCLGNRGRAASIGAVCTFCSVAVIQEPCLAVSFNVEHEVAHLLGAHHCTTGDNLMKKEVQLCKAKNDCKGGDIVFCQKTKDELKERPPLMNTQSCAGPL